MKRINALILAVLLTLPVTMLFGCTQKGHGGKIRVVCTIFPLYDWACQILGEKADNMELVLLLDQKIDLHSYQPSVEDIAQISACDLFVYVGGESDEWIDDVLKEAANEDMIVVNLLENLGNAAKAEEIKEGMERAHAHENGEHNHEDGGDAHENGEHDHEDGGDAHEGAHEYDEHIWLSLKNAQTLCPVMADALSSLDADNAETYQSNLAAYIEELSALDLEYQAAVDRSMVKTLLFGDRFPFRYLTDDYGLDYYAAFAGCSAETEASFETIVFLAGKADELGLKNIMVTESANQSIAKTIRDNTQNKSQQILVLNAMQSITSGDVKGGVTYMGVMESNLNVLKDALK